MEYENGGGGAPAGMTGRVDTGFLFFLSSLNHILKAVMRLARLPRALAPPGFTVLYPELGRPEPRGDCRLGEPEVGKECECAPVLGRSAGSELVVCGLGV